MKDLTCGEKSYYEDQCGPKIKPLSEEEDVESEEEHATPVSELSIQIAGDLANDSFSNPPEFQEAVMTCPVAHKRGEREQKLDPRKI